MNGIGLAIYLYVAILSALFGLVPMYFIFFECPKLEIEKIKNDIILQYKDNLKNLMPSTFNQSVVLFLSVGLGVGIFFYYITKAIVTLIAPMACMLFILYIVGLHKYPVYIYRGGFYFNRIYTWRGFDGYERVGDSIKLIGKKWVSPNVYLKDKDGKVEEILKKYFSH
jgi:hypothetical protein